MRCSHISFDGVGVLEALDAIIQKTSSMLADQSNKLPSIPWGDEVNRLPVCVVDNLRIKYSAEADTDDQVMYQKIRSALEYTATGVCTLFLLGCIIADHVST